MPTYLLKFTWETIPKLNRNHFMVNLARTSKKNFNYLFSIRARTKENIDQDNSKFELGFLSFKTNHRLIWGKKLNFL